MSTVFFWAGDPGSGSTWYRCVLPSQALTWIGHRSAASDNLAPFWREADCIVGARVASPDGLGLWKELKIKGKRLVVDLDDDYFHMDPRHHAQSGIDEWAGHADRLRESMDIADLVTAASEGIAESIRAETNTPVKVIPNGLHGMLIGLHRDYRPTQVTVGWSGSASTAGGLDQIKHALRKTAETGTHVRLVGPMGGHPSLRGLSGPASTWVEHRDQGVLELRKNIFTAGYFAKQEEYLMACKEFDIWLAPYEESRFNRAKFPTKVLESNFLGIPLVASNIRPYAEQIEHGRTGFLVKHEHEWRKYINMLVNEPDLREEIGLNARAQASQSILQTLNKEWEAATCVSS